MALVQFGRDRKSLPESNRIVTLDRQWDSETSVNLRPVIIVIIIIIIIINLTII